MAEPTSVDASAGTAAGSGNNVDLLSIANGDESANIHPPAHTLDTCHLLRLPRELRDQIYGYVAGDGSSPKVHGTVNVASRRFRLKPLLMETCKQIREEMVEIVDKFWRKALQEEQYSMHCKGFKALRRGCRFFEKYRPEQPWADFDGYREGTNVVLFSFKWSRVEELWCALCLIRKAWLSHTDVGGPNTFYLRYHAQGGGGAQGERSLIEEFLEDLEGIADHHGQKGKSEGVMRSEFLGVCRGYREDLGME